MPAISSRNISKYSTDFINLKKRGIPTPSSAKANESMLKGNGFPS